MIAAARGLVSTAVVGAAIGAAASACGGEKTATVQGPPLTIATPADAAASGGASSSPASVVPAPAPAGGSPITATFIDLSTSGAPLRTRPCDRIVVSVVRGHASALGEDLAPSDFLVAYGDGSFDVRGEGVAIVAAVQPAAPNTCTRDAKTPPAPLEHNVVRAGAAPDLTWAGGKMHAHLDVESDRSGAYFGRLEARAAVPEHMHDTSWEILCVVDAAGTFAVEGKPQSVGPRSVLMVPPKTKHSWTPDPSAPGGGRLVAIQFYSPAGPEQRFRAFAAAGDSAKSATTTATADAGASQRVDASRSR